MPDVAMNGRGLMIQRGKIYRDKSGRRVRAGFMFHTTEGIHVAIRDAESDAVLGNVPASELEAEGSG